MLSRFSNLTLSSTLNLAIVDDSVQFSHSVVSNPMDCRTSGFPVHHQLLELTQTHVHWVGDVFQSFQPLLSPSAPTFNDSQHQGLFQWLVLLIRWPKYWSFSISPSNEYSGLSSFRMHWLDLLAVQGTLKSLLQHHSSKPSIFWHSGQDAMILVSECWVLSQLFHSSF